MRALAIFKRPMVAIPVLAGLGLIAGLVFAADRLSARHTSNTLASCTQLTGKGDRCDRVYYTREQFDEIFAELDATAKAHGTTTFAEKLRVHGAQRLAPTQPAERPMMVRSRVASLDPTNVMFGVDTTLHTTFLDQGTVFAMLLEDPMAAPDTRVSETHTGANG
jgi:hypothetical protein